MASVPQNLITKAHFIEALSMQQKAGSVEY